MKYSLECFSINNMKYTKPTTELFWAQLTTEDTQIYIWHHSLAVQAVCSSVRTPVQLNSETGAHHHSQEMLL